MNIIRLVVLGILIYIAWRLLREIFGSITGPRRTNGGKRNETGARVQDILVEDPECHKLVPRNQAIRCRVEGKTYYFCSDICCDKFSAKQGKEA